MCGRQACTLAPDQVPKACSYRNKNGVVQQPRWKNENSGNYQPSYNIGPHTTTPIIVSAKQANVAEEEYGERVLCPMKWGLVPSWHRGAANTMGYNMINCRAETILDKISFSGPLSKGQRCVVVAEGFFEWQQTNKDKKQPYFLYFNDDVKDDLESVKGHSTPGKQLITIAGLYDRWSPPQSNEEPLLTYTIITVDASSSVQWLHHRMPAILRNDDEIRQWIDSGKIPSQKALDLLQPTECLQWYPVSTVVNNIRNKTSDCVQKIDLSIEKKKEKASSSLMSKWLKKSPTKRERKEDDSDEPEIKKSKIKIDLPK